MCADQWRSHLAMEHNTLSLLSMTFWEKLMSPFWNPKERCLTNSRHTRSCWRMKLAWRSKPCNLTTEESLCPKSLTIFSVNVESNDKQVLHTHHNKMELRNKPIGPLWSTLGTWFMHKELTWSLGGGDEHGSLHLKSVPKKSS
jgi:hypothetical protein